MSPSPNKYMSTCGFFLLIHVFTEPVICLSVSAPHHCPFSQPPTPPPLLLLLPSPIFQIIHSFSLSQLTLLYIFTQLLPYLPYLSCPSTTQFVYMTFSFTFRFPCHSSDLLILFPLISFHRPLYPSAYRLIHPNVHPAIQPSINPAKRCRLDMRDEIA